MGKYLDLAASVTKQPSPGAPKDPINPPSKGKTVIDGRVAAEIVHRTESMTWFIDKHGNHWRYFPRLRKSFPVIAGEKSVSVSDPTLSSPADK